LVKYDLVVIGGGPAGEKGAAQAAYFNKRVALVEAAIRPGGIAVSTAGIPTKTLREGAIYLSGVSEGALRPEDGRDPWRVLAKRRIEVSEFMTKAVERNLVRHGITRIRGRARLLSERKVEVVKDDGTRELLEAEVVLIATGSRAIALPGVPKDDPDIHDSETILRLDRAPDSLAVVGGGAIGCEYASIFGTLGVKVTLIEAGPQLVPVADDELSRVLAESFNGAGIRILTGQKLEHIERRAGELELRLSNDRAVRAKSVLIAIGRRPATDGLGLEEAGVALDALGQVKVDASYATSVAGVYAAGDVIGAPGLASASMEQARVAVCHAFGFEFKKEADRLRPNYIFSIPEIAWVGLTEQEAKASGVEYEVGRSSFSANAKARISGFADGLVKLVFRAEDRVLIGVHVIGEVASELVHIGQFVMHEGGTIQRFIDATFAVPTRSEAYKYAAYDGLMRLEKRRARKR
jgi:NAD(P) transhydrogenase